LLIPTQPQVIFEILADVTGHAELDGSGTVRGRPTGPTRLFEGAEFSMNMRQFFLHYRSLSRVVEFDEGRRITWESMGAWRGHKVIGGQRWRYVLIPSGKSTAVTLSYLWSYARWPLLTVWLPGYPARARTTLPRSLSRLSVLASLASGSMT